jgi:hypothetical protein
MDEQINICVIINEDPYRRAMMSSQGKHQGRIISPSGIEDIDCSA